MTIEQTAQQLELAAQILRTGHPFEVRHDTSDRWHASLGVNPAQAVLQNWCLRPVLATPPYPAQLHNPDNLTAEQVGVGYRLALPGESAASPHDFWDGYAWKKAKLLGPAIFAWCCRSCRLPLSVPWPEVEKPDPYAELKDALAAKVIEEWQKKPEETTFTLPPPPPGLEWHRTDGWKPGDLPRGYRPCVKDERETITGFMESLPDRNSNLGWVGATYHSSGLDFYSIHHRTTRPLVFQHAGKSWTYHRPGDPMPCDGERMVEIVLQNGLVGSCLASLTMSWTQGDNLIIGWRYAAESAKPDEPQTKKVPLGPEDVPPGSVFGKHDRISFTWHQVIGVYRSTIKLPTNTETYAYEQLVDDWLINRSLSKGQWNPDAWEPCSKTIPA